MRPICRRRPGVLKSEPANTVRDEQPWARTLKTGQSRVFVGYKKRTFRLWLRRYERGVCFWDSLSPRQENHLSNLRSEVIESSRRDCPLDSERKNVEPQHSP
jgi:hypothetical protein